MLHFLLSKKLVFIALSFDIGTSWHQQELNPTLGRGTFGIRQASVASGITIGELLLERRLKLDEKTKSRTNLILTGSHLGAGLWNLSQRSTK